MESFYLCNSEIFGLSNSTAVVYNFLCKVNNVSTGKSFYKRSNIAASCHVSESTVARALRTLRAKGLLAIKSRFDEDGRQTSNNYILIDNPQLRFDSKPSPVVSPKPAGEKEAEGPRQTRLFPLRLSTESSSLSPNAVKVYSYLSYRADATGKCMPSKREIAGNCSISLSSVWRAMRELINADLVELHHQNRMQTCGNNGTSVNLYVLKYVLESNQVANGIECREDSAAADPSLELTQQPFQSKRNILSEASENLISIAPLIARWKLHYELSRHEHYPESSRFTASFFTCDTLPRFSGDTPRTKPRKKATFNLREKSCLGISAKIPMKNSFTFAGDRINPARLE